MPSALEAGKRDHELIATLLLIEAKADPLEKLANAIDAFASAVRYLEKISDQRQQRIAHPDAVAKATAMIEGWKREHVDVRIVFEPSYPANLRAIFNKPPLLFVKGHWDESVDSWGIAVVGTRAASEHGLRRARRLATKLSAAGITVFSGLAKGIDGAAHEAALAANGRTVAVMGTGINHVYPAQHRDLARRILASGGALVTQFFPEQSPTKWTFPMRNVVMSGLSIATVVIEAGETSGARKQARNALEHGRSVLLLRSLVESYAWARKMVEHGEYGTRAIVIDSPDDVIDRVLHANVKEPLAV